METTVGTTLVDEADDDDAELARKKRTVGVRSSFAVDPPLKLIATLFSQGICVDRKVLKEEDGQALGKSQAAQPEQLTACYSILPTMLATAARRGRIH